MPEPPQLPMVRLAMVEPDAPLPWLSATIPASVKLMHPCLLPAPELLPLIVVTLGTPVMVTGAAMVGRPPLITFTVFTLNVMVCGVATPPSSVLASALASSMAARRLHLPLMSAHMPSPLLASVRSVLPMLTTKALLAAMADGVTPMPMPIAASDSSIGTQRRTATSRGQRADDASGEREPQRGEA